MLLERGIDLDQYRAYALVGERRARPAITFGSIPSTSILMWSAPGSRRSPPVLSSVAEMQPWAKADERGCRLVDRRAEAVAGAADDELAQVEPAEAGGVGQRDAIRLDQSVDAVAGCCG